MPTASLNMIFVTTTFAVVVAAWVAAHWFPSTEDIRDRSSTKSRFWLWGVAAFVGYSICRDAAIVTLLRHSGVSPWTFLVVDLACLVPYLLAAPRAVRSALQGRIRAFVGWTACFMFGALAPIAYVALVLKESAGSMSSLAAIYLLLVVCCGVCGLLRKSGRLRFLHSARGHPFEAF